MSDLEKLRTELEQRIAELYPDEERIVVHGEGARNARVMLIGEAPGEQETKQRRPFVGKAGKNLDEFLAYAEIDRAQLYVSNVVKYRPTKLSKASRQVNRPPTKQEIALFLPYLLREIMLIEPKVIVTLGNVPLRALMGDKCSIGDMHGRVQERGNMRIYPMYHPASLIYNPQLREVYYADVGALGAYLRKNREIF